MLLLSAGVLAGLAAGEAALALWKPELAPPAPIVENELFVADPDLGYRGRRSTTIAFEYPHPKPRVLTIRHNASGYRGRRELPGEDQRPRVIVLGDSFVYGSGVEEEERFTELIEEGDPGIRVDNLGMGGFGPDLMIRALEKDGLGLRPRVVLLCIWTADFPRVAPFMMPNQFLCPRYALEEGELVTRPHPGGSWWFRSRVAQLVMRVSWRIRDGERRTILALLARIGALAQEHRFSPITVFFPPRSMGEHDRERVDVLRDGSAAAGVPFLDLSADLHAAGAGAFIEHDVHFSPLGHRIVAERLRPAILAALAPR